MARPVSQILLPAELPSDAGGRVLRAFPTPRVDYLDPFLLLERVTGGVAAAAPPRGFEAITCVLAAPGAAADAVRLWLNLPRAEKARADAVRTVVAADLPAVRLEGASVRVLSGEAFGTRGPVDTVHPMVCLHVMLDAGGALSVPVAEEASAAAFVLDGTAAAGGRLGTPGQCLVFGGRGGAIEIAAVAAPAALLVLAAEPLREPIARRGAVVMTTRAELQRVLDEG